MGGARLIGWDGMGLEWDGSMAPVEIYMCLGWRERVRCWERWAFTVFAAFLERWVWEEGGRE